jgi:hypothetical protein
MRRVISFVGSAAVFALGFATSSLCHAQTCEKGDWFCDPAAEPPPSTPPPPPEPEASPRERRERRPPPEFREREQFQLDQPVFPPPRFRRRPRFPRWGASVHVFGALLGDDSTISRDASMGGLGVGLRRFFLPELALEANLEFGFGTDYNGYERQEASLLFHAVGVLNPRSVVRAYVFGGFGFSGANVAVRPTDVTPVTSSYDDHYSYVGVDLGAGVEIRVTRHAAIHADILGFVRDRTDDDNRSRPEFIDPKTGRTTNSSGGALLRVGTQFYW